jgi:hypothetical protein
MTYCVFSERLKVQKNALLYSISKKPIFAPRLEDSSFLSRKSQIAKALGESRSQAVKRFLALEHSPCSKDQFESFNDVMEEYFLMGHVELVPTANLEKSQQEIFYLPMHAVRKETSSVFCFRCVCQIFNWRYVK